jgi:hypothetical protein
LLLLLALVSPIPVVTIKHETFAECASDRNGKHILSRRISEKQINYHGLEQQWNSQKLIKITSRARSTGVESMAVRIAGQQATVIPIGASVARGIHGCESRKRRARKEF